MSVFNSIRVSIIVVLLIAGALIGIFAVGNDLLNPNTNQANAERVRAKTEHEVIMNNLEEQREKAKTEAEIASIKREQEIEQKRFEAEITYIDALNAKKLAAYDRWIDARDKLLLLSGTAICLAGLAWVGTRCALLLQSHSIKRALANHPQQVRLPERATITPVKINKVRILPPQEPYEPFNNPDYPRIIIRQTWDNGREKQDDEILNARLESVSRPTQSKPRVRIINGKQYHPYPQAN
jgi:hypothetical protein